MVLTFLFKCLSRAHVVVSTNLSMCFRLRHFLFYIMANTIWKFEVELTTTQTVKIPENAEILTCQLQDGKPHIWAKVNPEKPKEMRLIGMFGTGHPMPTMWKTKYISTIQKDGFVWHFFELKSK